MGEATGKDGPSSSDLDQIPVTGVIGAIQNPLETRHITTNSDGELVEKIQQRRNVITNRLTPEQIAKLKRR